MTLNNPFGAAGEAPINAQISSNGGSTTVTVSRPEEHADDAPQEKLQTSLGSSGSGVHSTSVGADGQTSYQHHVNREVTGGVDAPSGPQFLSAKMRAPMAASDVRDHDRVLIGGVETMVGAAVASGLLSPDFRTAPSTSGNTALGKQAQELQAAKEQAEKQAQQEPADDHYSDFNSSKPQALSGEAEGFMSEAVSKMNHNTASSILGTILAGRNVSVDQLEQAGQALGITPQEAFKRLETVMEGMRQQVVNAVGQEVIDWAQQNDPKAVQNASSRQAMEGSLRGWGDLNARYMAELPKLNPTAIVSSEAGKQLGARVEKNGDVTINLPNGIGRVSWGVALKSGWIAPRFGNAAANHAYPQMSDAKAQEFMTYFKAPQRTQAERKSVLEKFSNHFGTAQMRRLIGQAP
jgi:hypothetical protein